jgi:hypothetical protein
MAVNTIAKFYRLLLAALVAASLIFHLAILWASRHHISAGYGDFIIFYTGAQIINDGKSKELFKVETQNAYQAKFEVPQLEWPLPFNHAPYELFLFLPLAHFSYPVAHAIWSGMNLLLLACMLQWLLHYAHSPNRLFIAASVLAWFPTMEALRLGQDSIVSVALMLVVFAALKRQRDAWAGFFLALGLYKPQLVLPMAGVFLLARRWQSLIVFGVTGGVLAAVSLAMVGRQGIFDFVSILKSMGNYAFVVRPALMPNIRGLSNALLRGENFEAVAATGIISLALYAFCLYLWRGKFDVVCSGFDLKFSLTLITTVLISYHLYAHDLFLLSLSMILLFRYISFVVPHPPELSNVFYGLLLIYLLPVMPRYLIESRLLWWWSVPVLLLYLIVSVEILKRRRLEETGSGALITTVEGEAVQSNGEVSPTRKKA